MSKRYDETELAFVKTTIVLDGDVIAWYAGDINLSIYFIHQGKQYGHKCICEIVNNVLIKKYILTN